MLAKSRLKSKTTTLQVEREEKTNPVKKERVRHVDTLHNSTPVGSKYLKHLPILLFSFPFYFGLVYVLTQISPELIKNMLLPNSYLPLLVLIYFATLFSFTFFLLSFRRGIVVSSVLTIMVFAKLQQLQFEIWWISLLLLITVICFFLTRAKKTILHR